MNKIWELLVKAIAPSIITWLKDIITNLGKKLYDFLTGWYDDYKVAKEIKGEVRAVQDITKEIYRLEMSLEDVTDEAEIMKIEDNIERLEAELRVATRRLNSMRGDNYGV